MRDARDYGALEAKAREVFGVRPLESVQTRRLLRRCAAVYRGRPEWLDEDPENQIRTVGMARSICSETARLAVLAAGVTVGGGTERAAWLQQQIDRCYFSLRHWAEQGCAYGTVILKPNGRDVELLTPEQFFITDTDGGSVTGAVFFSRRYDQQRGKYFTRMEYHRFLPDGRYGVSNRCLMADSPSEAGREVAIEATPWAALAEDVIAEGVERPLFGVLRMPAANYLDPASPMGLPVFADALEELRDLDVAYSRNASEIYDSRRLALLDDRLTEQAGVPVGAARRIKLPRFIKRAFGSGASEYYQEIDPALNTETRLKGIDALLSQIGFKCGFSNGYFVFNQRSGLVTATQVEADDRRTVQLVKDVRDKLETALDGLIYALDRLAEGYALTPAGAYEAVYDFGDVTYNREEDRARWYGYVADGKAPFWYYLTKFEGYSEEQAKAVEAAARPMECDLTADGP